METLRITIFLALAIASCLGCSKSITILSNFHNSDDLEFYKSIYPWIVENIGPNLKAKYYFSDFNEDTEARYCIFRQIDAMDQASYLKCNVDNSLSSCSDDLNLNRKKLEKCMKKDVEKIERRAIREFSKNRPVITPFIILPNGQTVGNATPRKLLKDICNALFKRNRLPIGCTHPSQEPLTNTTSTTTTPETPTITVNSTTTEKLTTQKSTSEKPTTDTSSTEKSTTEKPEIVITAETTATKEEPSTIAMHTTTENLLTTLNLTTTVQPSMTPNAESPKEPNNNI